MQHRSMKNAQEMYKKQDVLTAGALELIIMLYDGIRKNIIIARRAIARRDMETAHNRLMKTQDIVTELINCLDLTIPLSDELLRIYEFMLRSLEEANLKKDADLLGDLLEIAENLRGAWVEVNATVRDSTLAEESEAAQ